MKLIIVLSLLSVAFAKDIAQYIEQKIEAENQDEIGIAYQMPFPMPDSSGMIQGPDYRFQLSPGFMENQGMYPMPMESMPVPRFPGVNMPGFGMGMGMPNQGMNPNFGGYYPDYNQGMNGYPGYPGNPSYNQGIGQTNACGCSSNCGMPCNWWGCQPCNPCPPCNQPTEVPTTSTSTTTTTTTPIPTIPPQITPTPPQENPNCPCQPVCPPCFPW